MLHRCVSNSPEAGPVRLLLGGFENKQSPKGLTIPKTLFILKGASIDAMAPEKEESKPVDFGHKVDNPVESLKTVMPDWIPAEQTVS